MKNYKILHILNDHKGGINTVVAKFIEIFPNSDFINIDNMDFFRILPKFKNISKNYDIVHFHGAWNLNIILSSFTSRPIIISPHGSFHPEGLKKSKLKKIIAKFLYVKRCYNKANIISALTNQEMLYIKEFGIYTPSISVVSNAIDFDEKLSIDIDTRNYFLNIANGRRIVLFLARLDPQKGLEMLIDAFAEISSSAVLFIAGDGSDDFVRKLKNRVFELNLHDRVFFVGYLSGDKKTTSFDIADVYVLPSFNEGFSMTILEAYRQKVPVATTTTTPFEEIDRIKFGWYFDPNKDELKKALQDSLNKDKVELLQLGENGYNYMKNHYDLKNFKQSYEQLYDWILGFSEKPNFVFDKMDK
ncbi:MULTISPECIES: glycosyltransferase [unclassified Campylobacter]|uniref:glycosyltransferase n=1 Tax=unclassified Campylobacter TaxID=2593542 RepID=UPI003D3596BF